MHRIDGANGSIRVTSNAALAGPRSKDGRAENIARRIIGQLGKPDESELYELVNRWLDSQNEQTNVARNRDTLALAIAEYATGATSDRKGDAFIGQAMLSILYANSHNHRSDRAIVVVEDGEMAETNKRIAHHVNELPV